MPAMIVYYVNVNRSHTWAILSHLSKGEPWSVIILVRHLLQCLGLRSENEEEKEEQDRKFSYFIITVPSCSDDLHDPILFAVMWNRLLQHFSFGYETNSSLMLHALRSRFEINFLCDRDDRIAFHFNPRFTESDIVCNSFMANHWGQEERCTNFPFGAEEPFQVTIRWLLKQHSDSRRLVCYKG